MAVANTLISQLAGILNRDVLGEKILLAPSDRVGRQWIDSAAATGALAINIRLASPSRLMRDLAGEELKRSGLEHPSESGRLAILAETLAAAPGDGYFSGLKPTLSVLRMLDASIADLQLAGVEDPDRLLAALKPEAKAREMARIHSGFAAGLARLKLAGPQTVSRLATKALARLDPIPLLLLPRDLLDNLQWLERRFWLRWPSERKAVLEIDRQPAADLEPEFFTADGQLNEARGIFRRIAARGVRLDQVEVVAVQAGAAAALCQAAGEYFRSPGGAPPRIEDLPLTFADGIPPHFCRPVRLLHAWLDWLASGRSAPGLAALCDSGLLAPERIEAEGSSPERLGMFLKALPSGDGPAAILAALKTGAGGDMASKDLCRTLCADILAPLAANENAAAILAATRSLLKNWAASRGELDAYALARILEDDFLSGRAAPWPGFDAAEWLASLVAALQIMGKGPQPGKLHVSGLGGGHAGRDLLFVAGLEDASFPGGDRQDPVLLDAERRSLPGEMPLSSQRRERRERELELLLARARGKAVLSCPRLDLSQGRELFPAEAFMVLSRNAEKTSEAFVPAADATRLSAREYWLGLLLDRELSSPAELSAFFPRLVGGEAARAARASDAFTAYDGFVPLAGEDFDREAPVFSASQLEKLAACPQEYFLGQILGLTPPQRHEARKGQWLPPNERGTLLHRVFKTFLETLRERGQRADAAKHRQLLAGILAETVADQLRLVPAADPLAHRREVRELEEACRIFLHDETILQRSSRPLWFEASFGMADGAGEHPWGEGEAVELSLGSGKTLRLRGRIDRVDRLDSGGLAVWDYKTGGADKYGSDDPFSGAGGLQTGLYLAALEQMVAAGETVATSGYFFPSQRESGRRINYTAAQLRPVLDIVDRLAGLLASGAFPFTLDRKYASRDFDPLYRALGGAEKLARQAARKSAAPGSPGALAQWAATAAGQAEQPD